MAGVTAHADRVRTVADDLLQGCLVVNADDWGQDRKTTRSILDCLLHGSVSAVSAMVFMRDSEHAADLARSEKVDAGLHLNFTAPFSAANCSLPLIRHQQTVAAYLRSSSFARALFHPGLMQSFEYVAAAQIEEYARLYATAPRRIDGHHHMHLCANVLLARLLPQGTLVRRNFSFQRGEKSLCNRGYRAMLDGMIRRRHIVLDFLFPLAPVEPVQRLERVVSLAARARVEVETHPVNPEEYNFLVGDRFRGLLNGVRPDRFPHPG
jgi:predicted glycoside hydrolase/deacetylase ChbG (UPF0249 family)